MQDFKAKLRVATVVILFIWTGIASMYGLLKPISNGCLMTYMYPTYIPISSRDNVSRAKYGLYLYHEGWKRIDFKEHVKKLSGVPVLFIPGNGGSYKQVRSLAAESERAYQAGPLERTFYQEAMLTPEEGGEDIKMDGYELPNQYNSMLDWFAVDLEGELSAMDGRILEEHTEYVVYAILRILDQYKESYDVRGKEGAAVSRNFTKSVILVGHSMGGFVARAAIVHPHLRKSAVETVFTLSSPHQSPPLALQPSLGHYFAQVNEEWRKGYEVKLSRAGRYVSPPALSHVVVISVSGGVRDYQVRSKLESLDGIVPPTHGFMVSSSSMKNVWLSMEHQAILWCNQLVIQVSHTLLSLIDPRTGQSFSSTQRRLAIFTRMLQSGMPQSFNWMEQPRLPKPVPPSQDENGDSGSQLQRFSACPSNVHWGDEGLERDLYIQASAVTVLAMDGRRRWMDIQKLGSHGKSHFIFVTNLAPCTGVRLHLWPLKGKSSQHILSRKTVLDVTTKMVQIPSGPAPRQIEPGSQSEQVSPSAVLWLSPEDMHGFRFLTISVAPRPTVSGRPPPAASMAVGQFLNPKEGNRELSSWTLLQSIFSPQVVLMEEDHPLAFNLSFTISLGLLPATLSLKTAGCGIKNSELPVEESGDVENSRLCRLRCFPSVALAWDKTSGLHVFPNLYSETIVVDSSSAFWSSSGASEKTTLFLLVDPHCSYMTSLSVSIMAASRRFLLSYFSQITGLSIAVIIFALMRQAHAWESDLPIPSMLVAVESNLRMPFPFLCLAAAPILLSLVLSLLMSQPFPPVASFVTVSLICYLLANGSVLILILIFQMAFYMAAIVHVFIKTRWQSCEEIFPFQIFQRFLNLSSSFLSLKVTKVLRVNPLLATAFLAITLTCSVHPALGLFILLMSHVLCCHSALCSFLMASIRSHTYEDLFDSRSGDGGSEQFASNNKSTFNPHIPLDESYFCSPNSRKSYADSQLEVFYHRNGLLILHILATSMFLPSLIAWFQRIGLGQSFPWFIDSSVCIGVIFHGVFNSKPEFNYSFSFLGIPGRKIRLSSVYFFAGYFTYLSGLALAPYRALYAIAAIGVVSLALRIVRKGETEFSSRKHSHRH